MSHFGKNFNGFLGVNCIKRHLAAYIASHYSWGIPLEALKLLSKEPRNVAGDDGLGSHSAVLYTVSGRLGGGKKGGLYCLGLFSEWVCVGITGTAAGCGLDWYCLV